MAEIKNDLTMQADESFLESLCCFDGAIEIIILK